VRSRRISTLWHKIDKGDVASRAHRAGAAVGGEGRTPSSAPRGGRSTRQLRVCLPAAATLRLQPCGLSAAR
jgi:hypothetical protein